jgi:hypothetical protein
MLTDVFDYVGMLKLSKQIDLHLQLLLLVLLEIIDFDLLYGDQLPCSEA